MGKFFVNTLWVLITTYELWLPRVLPKLRWLLDAVGLVKLPDDIGELFGRLNLSTSLIVVVIGIAGLYLTNREFWHRIVGYEHPHPGRKVPIATLIMIVCGIGFVTAAGYKVFVGSNSAAALGNTGLNIKNVSGPPIEWRFDKPVTLFWYSRKPGEAVVIEAIVINGTNKSGYALKGIKATIVADMQDHPFEMRVNSHGSHIKPEESTTLIPPGASFDLTLGIGAKGISAEDFLNQYSALKFTFEYTENGSPTSFVELFSRSYIEDQIAFLEEKTKAQRASLTPLDKSIPNEAAIATEPVKPYEINLARELLFFVHYSLENSIRNVGRETYMVTTAPQHAREEPFVIQTVDDDTELRKIVDQIEHDHAWQIAPNLRRAYTEIAIISRHLKGDFAHWKKTNPDGYAKTLHDRTQHWSEQLSGFNGTLALYAQYDGSEGYEDINRRRAKTNLIGWGDDSARP